MEPNETNMRSTAQEQANVEPAQAQNACGCGGGGKGSNMASVAIWIMLLIGFACVLMFIRSNTGSGNDEALVKRADEYYQKQDFEKMTDCLRQAAEHGYPLAQVYYGGCLKKGVGVAQDAPAAVEYFRKAAEQNNGVAFYELAVCYENGEGILADPDKAMEWYRKALNAGIGDAADALDRVYVQKANELYKHNSNAEAVQYLRLAAEHGYPLAQAYYGGCFRRGDGVDWNPIEAVKWFRKAAEQNNGVAFFELGVCYEDGEGVDRNLDTALEWYRKALDAGIEKAESAILRIEKTKAKTTGAATPSNG